MVRRSLTRGLVFVGVQVTRHAAGWRVLMLAREKKAFVKQLSAISYQLSACQP